MNKLLEFHTVYLGLLQNEFSSSRQKCENQKKECSASLPIPLVTSSEQNEKVR